MPERVRGVKTALRASVRGIRATDDAEDEACNADKTQEPQGTHKETIAVERVLTSKKYACWSARILEEHYEDYCDAHCAQEP